MKTIKLMNMALLCTALTLGACSNGEDGTDGLPGADGVSCWDLNGNGTGDAEEDVNDDGNFDALDCQGEQGVAGNANVQAFTYNLDVNDDYSSLVLDLNIFLAEPENYGYLFYIEHKDGLRYIMPGYLSNNSVYTRIFFDFENNNNFEVRFHKTSDNSSTVIPGGQYTKVIVVAVELNNASKNSESVMAELKTARVDTSDYNAVANYFGL
ncbi:hypothetical protein KIM67_01725 [Flagellimonas sp. 389]|uniref:hypothetical protein n=1 Tax=Flagellimonas sp. 389 TaxID=2835862 RepID=UPI001BD26E04|nr:hypothetical protein [Flagellimonas sp. 389]MBS9461112.1 hypothetical protein [Flagellimonas sp. 389]